MKQVYRLRPETHQIERKGDLASVMVKFLWFLSLILASSILVVAKSPQIRKKAPIACKTIVAKNLISSIVEASLVKLTVVPAGGYTMTTIASTKIAPNKSGTLALGCQTDSSKYFFSFKIRFTTKDKWRFTGYQPIKPLAANKKELINFAIKPYPRDPHAATIQRITK